MTAEIATLRVAGRNFGGWQSIEITRSIEQAASAFAFQATARYPAELNPIRIRPGDACEVLIGSERVITGYVDSVAPRLAADSHSIAVAGRSRTADLVDCSAAPDKASPRRWKARRIEQIAAELAAPYGVQVVAAVSTGAQLARHAVERGETVFECIERMARLRQLLVCDDAAGRLVLTRAGSTRAAVAIEEGVNLLAGDAKADASAVFSAYVVKGQRVGDDQDFGDTVAQITGEAADPAVTRKRVLQLMAENGGSAADAKARAAWEAATRLGKSLEATVTVQGWRQAPGAALWAPNLIVAVQAPSLALSGDLLITDVTLRLSDAGTIAELRLAPADAYKPEPPKPSGGSRAASGLWKEIAKGAKVPAKGAP